MSETDRSQAIGNAADDLKGLRAAAYDISDKASGAATDAAGHARDIAADAKDQASSLLDVAKDKASSVATEQKQNVAGYLDDVAQAVHRSGEQLEGHQDWIAHMVERGADELGALAATLRTNDLQTLLGELGSLATRQPALFVGASMAAGFALARVGRLAAAAPTTATPAEKGGFTGAAAPQAQPYSTGTAE